MGSQLLLRTAGLCFSLLYLSPKLSSHLRSLLFRIVADVCSCIPASKYFSQFLLLNDVSFC